MRTARSFDLHTHSNYSDGTLGPAEVVERARRCGVELLSITDHDSTSGLADGARQARTLGIRLLPGVEINTNSDKQIHILGYGIRADSGVLQEKLKDYRRRRAARVEKILSQLRDVGLEVGLSDIEGVSKESWGRPHVADALKKKGYVGERQEAFDRYLTLGKPGYVASFGPSPAEAITTIVEAGGAACLAHPGIVRGGLDLHGLKALGLEGLEVFYRSHTRVLTANLKAQAQALGLLMTGGSDFHGPGTGRADIGGVDFPAEDAQILAERFFSLCV
ncbi:MAG: hypothetical protein A3G41_00850 [Elusimicrobia bacterium RIFCSPLOWO2_12_FULL_59_9]|nr:MAG: hypothetical protein A3G41_00850 [Elusimicrobia bacterium RIFCSPLOWO2_12_FULL_59_9]